MEDLHHELLADTLEQRERDRDALVRMLTWALDEVQALGCEKSAQHLRRTIDCIRHEV